MKALILYFEMICVLLVSGACSRYDIRGSWSFNQSSEENGDELNVGGHIFIVSREDVPIDIEAIYVNGCYYYSISKSPIRLLPGVVQVIPTAEMKLVESENCKLYNDVEGEQKKEEGRNGYCLVPNRVNVQIDGRQHKVDGFPVYPQYIPPKWKECLVETTSSKMP